MNTISQLMNTKGNAIYSIRPDATVYDAIHLMAEKKIGALLVMDGDKLVGVISERDYARNVILKGRASESTAVKDIMTKRVIYAPPQQTIEQSLALMTEKRVRHLPILDQDKVVGVVSMGDLVKAIIAEQQLTIEQLERYIAG
ncbi:MAG: CBS domain-containing protein [Gammaproteobacteria bacterium]|nr:CBS domain-containing protein [Gammaproteobacteria bacterium]